MLFAAKITGTGSAFPAKRVTNAELAGKLAALGVETNDTWIRERSGIQERRYSDLTNPDESTAGLAATAAIQALEMARTSPQEIDQIILATCSPESTLPAVACRVQQQIGATRAWAMDINAACTGFVYGMVTAGQFLQNGQAGAALVIGSEVMHTRLDWKDRSSCILFGDAAGAVVLERVALGSSARILESFLMSDGRCVEMLHMPPCVLNPGSSFEQEKSLLGNIEMNGREIFKLAVRTMTDSAQYIMAKQGISPSEVDWFIPHQANLRILETVAQRLGLPMEKVLINVQRYGNTSAATIPTVLDEAVRDGRIQKGQLLLMDAFGAGGTYGAILLRW